MTSISHNNERILQPIYAFPTLLFHKSLTPSIIHAILLDQAFANCPRFLTAGLKLGPCLSSNVADHFLKSTKHNRLGELLPHQQPNTLKAYLKTS